MSNVTKSSTSKAHETPMDLQATHRALRVTTRSRSVLWPSTEITVRPAGLQRGNQGEISEQPVSLEGVAVELAIPPSPEEIRQALSQYAAQLSEMESDRIQPDALPGLQVATEEEVCQFVRACEQTPGEHRPSGILLIISGYLSAERCETIFRYVSEITSLEINISADQPVQSLNNLLLRAAACGVQHLVISGSGDPSEAEENTLPDALWQMGTLRSLELRYLPRISGISEDISLLTELEYLKIEGESFEFDALPAGLGALTHLNRLELVDLLRVKTLPASIGQLHNLNYLHISSLPLKILPDEVWHFPRLEHLMLMNLNLTHIPEKIGNLATLKTLVIDTMDIVGLTSREPTPAITHLPARLGELQQLTTLKLCNLPSLEALPQEISQLTNLTELVIYGNPHIERLPPEFAALIRLERLVFGGKVYTGYGEYAAHS